MDNLEKVNSYMAIEYEVIRHFLGSAIDKDLEEFTEVVRLYLADGWEPAGGVSVCSDKAGYPHAYQAVRRKTQ